MDPLRTAAQGAVERLLNLAVEVEAAVDKPAAGPLSAVGLRAYAEDIEYRYAPDFEDGDTT